MAQMVKCFTTKTHWHSNSETEINKLESKETIRPWGPSVPTDSVITGTKTCVYLSDAQPGALKEEWNYNLKCKYS